MLGEQLRKAREEADLSQEDVAKRARIDRSYLSQLERDVQSPTVQMLLRICKAIGVSAADILKRVEQMPPKRERHSQK